MIFLAPVSFVSAKRWDPCLHCILHTTFPDTTIQWIHGQRHTGGSFTVSVVVCALREQNPAVGGECVTASCHE